MSRGLVCEECTPTTVLAACRLDSAASGNSRDAFLVMWLYRVAHQAHVRHINGADTLVDRVALRLVPRLQKLLVVLPFKIELPHAAHIGPGLALPHLHSIVVNSRARVGASCTIFHGVTIGESVSGADRGCPTIEDHVTLGAGSIVIGPVRIGARSTVGAGAVVTKPVPNGAVVVGHNRLIESKPA